MRIRDHIGTPKSRSVGARRRWNLPGMAGAALPAVYMAAVTAMDLMTEFGHLTLVPSLIVGTPALAAVTSGMWGCLVYGALAEVETVVSESLHGWQHLELLEAKMIGLGIILVVSVLPGTLESRRRRTVRRLRAAVETFQQAILLPIQGPIADLHASAAYLAAEEEANIGGDLYDIVDTRFGVRMIIGDVRGKGLAAVAAATNLLGAFREAAAHAPDLPTLAGRLEGSVRRYNERVDADIEEFITATLVAIPTRPVAHVVSCGHPAPLLVRANAATEVVVQSSPPLGLGDLARHERYVATVPFDVGDRLLLFTDGITEARDSNGLFYPLIERVRAWTGADPDRLIPLLTDDLDDHTGGQLGDDAALLVGQRITVGETGR
jgi:serine phosphatase RsbU (regulator of sigma subunit)